MIDRLKQFPMKPVKVSGKLVVTTIITLIVLSAAMFGVTVLNSILSEAKLVSNYLESLPRVLAERSDDLEKTYSIFYEDCDARGNTGTMLYGMAIDSEESEGSIDDDTLAILETIRDSIMAQDASIADASGNILATTRSASSSPLSKSDIEWAINSKTGVVDLNMRVQSAADSAGAQNWESPSQEGTSENGSSDGQDDAVKTEPLLYSAQVGSGKYILFEFDFGSYSETYMELGLWKNLLARLLSGLDAFAIAEFDGGGGVIYPDEGLSEEEFADVQKMADDVAKDENGIYFQVDFTDNLKGAVYGITSLRDKSVLVGKVHLDEEQATVIIAVPFSSFMSGTILSCAVSLIFLVCSLIFLTVYVRKNIARRQLRAAEWKARKREARRRCLPGFVVALLVLSCLTLMLQGLEGMSSTASTTKSQRVSLEHEISYHETLVDRSYNYYMDRSITRANALARLLNEHPRLQTREDLQVLARVSGVDYLMLYDKNGNETMSSNSYTGYSVNDSKDETSSAYKSVLLGHPYAITEMTTDPTTGALTHTVASLMTDNEGLPNGFLVVSFDDSSIKEQVVDSVSESVVSSFATQPNQVAMAVDPETKIITAHTDKDMVGQLATDYLDEAILGHSFEGFTMYGSIYSYVSETASDALNAKTSTSTTNKSGTSSASKSSSSGSSKSGSSGSSNSSADKSSSSDTQDNKSCVMVVTTSGADLGLTILPIVLLLVFMFVALIVDYFIIVRVCTRTAGTQGDEKKSNKSLLVIFAYGYVALFSVFGVFAFIQALRGGWPAFLFVFGGEWSRGVNLFSLWMAVFVFSGILAVAFILRLILRSASKRVSPQTRTFTHLGDSVVTYGAVIAIFVYVLAMFGVDTTAILASAGIGAIALGMGAKDLIGDILAGIFIIFEGSIHVGDIVEIGGWRGRVTDMGIRTCEITNDRNDVKIVTNNRINDIINLSRKMTVCTADFEIPRTVEASKVGDLVNGYIALLVKEIPDLKENLQYEGVMSFSDESYTVRLRYQCNEAEREALTIKLNTVFKLILEKEEAGEAG